jgi:hypothetical protein
MVCGQREGRRETERQREATDLGKFRTHSLTKYTLTLTLTLKHTLRTQSLSHTRPPNEQILSLKKDTTRFTNGSEFQKLCNTAGFLL